jgi:hypothetical protein
MNKPPFKVGDKVRTTYHHREENVIHTVYKVVKDQWCVSGWRVNADGGTPCPTCGAVKGKPVSADSNWFELVKE